MSLQDIQLKILLDVKGLTNLNAVTSSLRGVHEAANATKKSTGDLGKSFMGFERNSLSLGKAVSVVESKYDSMYRAAYRLKAVGQDLNGVGMAGIGMLSKSASAWGDYEFSLNRAAGAMLVNRDLYPQLSKNILQVAKDVRLYNPQEVAQATYYWASTTGQQVKTLADLKVAMQGVTPILKAAAMTETNYEAAIKGVYNILTLFKLPLTKTTDVTEKLMLITQRTSLEFGDLIQSFKYVGPMAHSLGIPFETVAQLMGLLGDNAQKASMSGRGFGMMLQRLISPTAQGKKAMDKLFKSTDGLGKSWAKTVFPNGKFVGATRLIEILAKATKGLNDQQKQQFLDQITTNNGYRVLLPLLEEVNRNHGKLSKTLDSEKYSLEGAHAAFEKSFGYLAESWKGLMGLLQNSFMPIVLQVGKSVTAMAAPVVKALSSILSKLSDWLDANPRIVDFAVKVLAVGSALAAATGAALVFLGAVLGIGAGIGFVIDTLKLWRLGPIIGPLIVLGTIVAAVAKGFIDNTGGIRDAFKRLFYVIQSIFRQASKEMGDFKLDLSGLVDALKGGVAAAFKAVADAINWFADAIIKINRDPVGHKVIMAIAKAILLLAPVIGVIKAAGLGLSAIGVALSGWGLLVGPVLGVVKALTGFNAVVGIIKTVFGLVSWLFAFLMANPVVLAVAAIVAAIVGLYVAWENNFMGIRDIVAGVFNWIATNVVPVVAGIVNNVIGFITGLPAAISGIWSGIQSVVASGIAAIGQAVSPITGFFAALLAPIIALVTEHAPKVLAGLQQVGAAVSTFFTTISAAITDVINNYIIPTVQGVVDAFTTKFGEIVAVVGPLVDSIVTFLLTLAGAAGDVFRGIVDVINTVFMPIWTVIVNVVGAALGIIGTLLKEAFIFFVNDIATPFSDALIHIFGVLFDTLGGIVKGAMTIIEGIIKVGVAILKGIIDFFTAVLKGDWKAAWNAVSGIVSGVIDGIKTIVGGGLEILGSIVSGGLRVVKEAFLGAVTAIVSIISSLVTKALEVGGNIVKSLWNGVSGYLGWWWGKLGSFISGIISTVTGVPGKLYDIGIDMVKGLWNGIVSKFNWLVGKVTDFIRDAIPGPVKDFLGIHSPSRLMAEYGGYVVDGLAKGIAGTDSAYRAMSDTATKLADIAKAGAAEAGFAVSGALDAGSSSFSVTSDNTSTIRLEVAVTSPDGSVSQLDQQQLANLLNSSDLVRQLEHMASVG